MTPVWRTAQPRATDAGGRGVGTILVQGDGCPADLALPNHTLSGTQTLEATASATLGPNLTANGDDIVVNAPTVTIMGGTSISGTFSVGNSTSCP